MKNVTKGIMSKIHFTDDDVSCDCGFALLADEGICTATFHYKKDDSIEYSESPPKEQAIANANLYFDAHNTFQETGLTPSELKDDRDKWMEAHKASLNVDADFMPRVAKLKEAHDELKEQNRELVEALRYFTDRVEAGTIKSSSTYGYYKKLLTKHQGKQSGWLEYQDVKHDGLTKHQKDA